MRTSRSRRSARRARRARRARARGAARGAQAAAARAAAARAGAAAGPRRRRPRAARRPRAQRRRRARPARRRRAGRLPLGRARRRRRGRRALRRAGGPRTDAHPLDAAPAAHPVEIVRDPAHGVAPVEHRGARRRDAAHARRCADFDPRRPFWLGGEVAIRRSRTTPARLLAAGWEQAARRRVGLSPRCPDGVPLDAPLRAVLRDAPDDARRPVHPRGRRAAAGLGRRDRPTAARSGG